MGLHVGIDLGTCYSAIAYFDRRYNKPVMINNSMNKTITPSVLYFDGDEVHFGEYAKSMRAFESEKAVSHFKQEMGTPGYCVQFGVNTYNAEDLSKIFLQKLVADAEESIGQKISSAVITVPAYFNHQQREATRRAGERAGLEVLQIINEPTAAAIAYGLLGDLLPQTILVYDLGGGTFDVTLMSISNNGIDVLATGGDHRLGGKNWDDAIALYLNGLFQAEHGIDIFDDFADCYDLQLKSEAAKVQLTLRDKVNVSLTYKGKRGSYEITLDTFNDITRDLMKRTEAFVEDVLYEKNLTWADIDGVLLVGGSSRMRMVPEFVRAMSGKEPLKTGIYVDDAVAQGAAILAEIQKARESGNLPAIEGKTITDVTAHSLGMVAISRDRSKFINEILIRHNSRIPAQKTEPFKVSRKNCRNGETDIYVLQGESQRPLDCQILGKYVVSDIDLSSQKEAVIDVTYSYDIDGIVHVGAFQQKANKQLPVRVEPVPADMSWLDQSPDEMIKVPEQVSIMLAVDLSPSMSSALDEVKRAMNKMVDNLSVATVKIGLIAFADWVQTMCELTEDKKAVAKAINCLSIGRAGISNDANPFPDAYNILKHRPGKRIIVVLTDGQWSYPVKAIVDARKCIKENIEVIAIGFACANEDFLKKISSSDENALYTSLDNLADSFVNIAQVISESSLSSR